MKYVCVNPITEWFEFNEVYEADGQGFVTNLKGDEVYAPHASDLRLHDEPKSDRNTTVFDFTVDGKKVEGLASGEHIVVKRVADRNNDGKPEMSFVLQGPKGLAGLAQVLEFGSRKYDRGNWLKGFPDTSLIDSMMRHLTAYISGEVLDPESGLPHIDHIHANAKFLAEHGDRDGQSSTA